MTRIEKLKQAFTALQSQIGNDPISLALGDYVIYKGQEVECYGTLCKPGEIQFASLVNKEVNITSISEDGMEYGIDGCAWVNRSSLLYVRDADIDSLSKIIAMLEEEEDGGDEECEQEDDEFDEDESEMEIGEQHVSGLAPAAVWPFPEEVNYAMPGSDRSILNLHDTVSHKPFDLRDQKSLHRSMLDAQDNAEKKK